MVSTFLLIPSPSDYPLRLKKCLVFFFCSVILFVFRKIEDILFIKYCFYIFQTYLRVVWEQNKLYGQKNFKNICLRDRNFTFKYKCSCLLLLFVWPANSYKAGSNKTTNSLLFLGSLASTVNLKAWGIVWMTLKAEECEWVLHAWSKKYH